MRIDQARVIAAATAYYTGGGEPDAHNELMAAVELLLTGPAPLESSCSHPNHPMFPDTCSFPSTLKIHENGSGTDEPIPVPHEPAE